MMDRGVPRGFAAFAGVALAAALACAMAALAYNPEQDQVNGKPVPALWQNNRITWSLNPTIGSNVDVTGGTNPVPVATAISNAFAAWQNAGLNGQSLASLSITRGADTTLSGPDPVDVTDCVNIVTFQDSNSSDFPAGTGIIAFTAITTSFGPPPTSYSCTSGGHTTQNTCTVASCLIDADMVFNPNEMFSTATPTESGHFDVQAIATHESGHFLGLDHSGIAHAIMYPYGDAGGNGSLRTLAVDDVAGICFLYPNVNAGTLSGNLSGTVTQGGAGILAAHVVAIDTNTGNAVVDALTNPDGSYRIAGVPPGSYDVLVLPLAPDADSGIYTLDNFGGWACGFGANVPPCCDPALSPACDTSGALKSPTNYTGTYH